MLLDEARATGAEGEPERELTLTRRHSRDEEVDDVRAADEEEQPRCREQDDERGPHVADHLLAQRNEMRVVDPRLVTEALAERLRDRTRLPLRLRHRDPFAQPADNVPVVRRATRRYLLELTGRPELGTRRDIDRGG